MNENSEFAKYMDAETEARIWNNSITTELKKENTLEIARNLLLKNIDINIIAEVTGLSIEEINRLK